MVKAGTYHNQRTGIAFIPFTFPTAKVRTRVWEGYDRVDKWNLPLKTVQSVYDWYKQGVTVDGKGVWQEGNKEILPYIEQKSQLEHIVVASVLLAIKKMAQEGEIDSYYFSFEKPETSVTERIRKTVKKSGETIKKAVTEPGTVLKNVKWIGVIAIVGVGLYLSWPLLNRGRKLLKTRGD